MMAKMAASVRIDNPALIVIGEVVKVRERLLWLAEEAKMRIG